MNQPEHKRTESAAVRLAVDIGGTFTDVALEKGVEHTTVKVLTTPRAPELGVIEGIAKVLAQAQVGANEVELILHGTTLGTNAIIERKGAKTALLVTEGFRDSVEMAYENRFDQYDIAIHKPAPLVPRDRRWPVRERIAADGEVLVPLDLSSVDALLPSFDREQIESVAIGFMHSYRDPRHEQLVAEHLAKSRPDLTITLSSEVCPEIREYERMSTACANAYIQPLMSRYLGNLAAELKAKAFDCPLLLMMSSGGLTTLETAARFPVRLVESGPAGGAILAAQLARELGAQSVLSFDMGGTTAKVCLIDDGHPQTARVFEVDRAYRFTKGSGLPVRIPVIEMVEIGAGGGSIARVDAMQRINVGPDSAGSEPGPACYDRGATSPTVTDADVSLGRIRAEGFAGGNVQLVPAKAAAAIADAVATPLGLENDLAAFGVSEIVDENMSNAARVHAVELGKEVSERTMIAFGGGGPLHAARMAEKLGLERVVVPRAAGVGSAIGFLRAPISYEVVQTYFAFVDELDTEAANDRLQHMYDQAQGVVSLGAKDKPLEQTRLVFMRYSGQGHEIAVPLPNRTLTVADRQALLEAFETAYSALYSRVIPGARVEILNWVLSLSTEPPALDIPAEPPPRDATPYGKHRLFEPNAVERIEVDLYDREQLLAGDRFRGPALVTEAQTTTFVTAQFAARVDARGNLILEKEE